MNEPTVVQYCFGEDILQRVIDEHLLTSDWHCISEPKELFELVRIEDIESYNDEFPVKRI